MASQIMHCTVKLRGAPIIICGVSVSVGHKVYAFGGSDHIARERPGDQINVYVFNTVSLRWRTLPPVTTTRGGRPHEVPCNRLGHTAVVIEDIVYLWGGVFDNKLYAFDVHAHRWIMARVSGTVPGGRSFHSACVLGKVMYVHGGHIWDGHTNDMYRLDTTTMVWSFIKTRGTMPPGSSWHSATIIGTKMFVFGGEGNLEDHVRQLEDCNNIRVFDPENNSWLNTPSAKLPTQEHKRHSAFAYNGELYIFGGISWPENSNWHCSSAMWKFSPETFSWKEVELKENDPSGMYDGCCCMVASRVIIFGGCKDIEINNDDLYVLDLSPSLKTLCKIAVIQYGLEQSKLPHNIRWELAAMTDRELEDSA